MDGPEPRTAGRDIARELVGILLHEAERTENLFSELLAELTPRSKTHGSREPTIEPVS